MREQVEKLEGSEHLAIIDLHRMMLRDDDAAWTRPSGWSARSRLNAEWAVKRAVRKIKGAFDQLADEYFKERRSDVDFVGERIIKNLLGQAVDVDEPPPPRAPSIVAHDLSPADTALLLHERKVAAFVTDAGAHHLPHRHRGPGAGDPGRGGRRRGPPPLADARRLGGGGRRRAGWSS